MGVPNTETTTQKVNLDAANPDGTQLGQSATDRVGAYGAVPLAQRAHTEVIATLAGVVTTTASGTVASAYTSALGNWTTLSSQSGASSTVVGYTATNTASASASVTGLLAEIAITLVALGFWRQT